MATRPALVIVDGEVQQAPATDIISSAISDTNDKFVATTVDGAIDELGETKTWNGFDLRNPDSKGTLTWDNSARKFSLAVKSGETDFYYWIGGKKYTQTSTIVSSVLPDVSGTYYFYIDDTGVMQPVAEASATQDLFYTNAIVALVYWNSTAAYGLPAEERHGKLKDSNDHEMEHRTLGARYESGFALTGLVDGQDTFTGVNSGYYWDEDQRHSIAAAATIPFLYRLGADAEWTWSTADNKVGFFNGGSYACWNKESGGVWSLEPADSSHDYILIFVTALKTLTGYSAFSKIIDQAGYGRRADAREAIEGAKKKLILDGLPSPEMVFLGVYICRRNGDLENLADGSVYFDLRGTSSRGTASGSSASNLAADLVVDATGFSGNLSSTDTDQQTLNETIDQLTLGTKIQIVASDPASPATNDTWLNTTDDKLKIKTSTGTYAFEASTFTAD